MEPSKVLAFLCLNMVFRNTRQEVLDESFDDVIGAAQDRQGHFHCGNNSTCLTWFVCNSVNECQCGDGHNYAVVCDDLRKQSAVLDCHCVTYDEQTESTYVGLCYYNCQNSNLRQEMDYVHRQLPRQPERLLNESACTHFNRMGLLCGDCAEGHSPFVLSYNLSCVKCPDSHKNWWKFILAGFVPLTLFYFFVLFFNINVTSSRLHGVVWFSQALSMPAFVRLLMNALSHGSPRILIATRTFLVFYSFWNLDLLRSVIPDICLNVTTLQALALDYLVALYPFVLILLSYFLIELYDRQYAVIVTIWKPFRKLLSNFRQSWDIRTSIIDSIATFFLLSYVKVLSVTADLLIPTEVYKLGLSKSQAELRVYYTPTVHYFGRDHLPYAILAIVILTLFVFIPTTIFLFYPLQFFQKFLSLFPINWHFLHAFVDSFQGCYKDGTEPGTFDCRWFSNLILLIRLLLFVVYGMTLTMIFFIYGAIIILVFLIVLINIQPFKKVAARYPSTDIVFHILISLTYTAIIARKIAITEKYSFNTATLVITLSTAFIPIIYTASFICFWITSKVRSLRSLI